MRRRPTFIEYEYDDRTDMFRRVQRSEVITPRVVLYANEATNKILRAAFPHWETITVTKRVQMMTEARRRGTVVFVDDNRLHELEEMPWAPVVCVVNGSAQEFLTNVIDLLEEYPRIAHHVGAAFLTKPDAAPYLVKLVGRLAVGNEASMVSDVGVGRVAMLAQSSRREVRIERMREFLEKQAINERLIAKTCDVFEELATNALYDAPVEAGFLPRAVPRTEDIELPADRACQVSYAVEDDRVLLRVRDPFGALPLRRLLAVLKRCNQVGAELDESRGGAGLGMWRVFSLASTLAITVIPGKLTEVVVTLTSGARKKQLSAVHLDFVHEDSGEVVLDNQITDSELLDHSITLIRVA